MRWRIWTASLLFLAILLTLALLTGFFVHHFSQPGPLTQTQIVTISTGQTLSKISKQLHRKKILSHPKLFSWHVRLRKAEQKLQAGEYKFSAHVTPKQVLSALVQGNTVKHSFTVPEGTTISQVLENLNQSELLSGESTFPIAEGDILPETYSFTRNETRNTLLKRMRKAMTETLQELWTKRDPDVALPSAREALILASIVEKETKLAEERPRIAAVLLNRLKKGMKLQVDPTVIYGINRERAEPIQQLTKKDLEKVTSYNTYLHAGLPPTPICNPGYASLYAVLHPSKTDELFFVADGTGGHVFSKTYQSHKKHHENWRKLRKERFGKKVS